MVDGWRVIEADEAPRVTSAQTEPKSEGSLRSLVLALAAVVLVLVGLAIWLTMPQGGVQLDVAGQVGSVEIGPGASFAATSEPLAQAADLVVDIEGAVLRPGVHRLPAGSRVGDAIAAAGGYSTQLDIGAAAERLNLAEPLADGTKIRVPMRGEVAVAVPSLAPGPGSGTPAGGLIDVNHASADQLDTLPGIGPVTAKKIIDARAQTPFASVDELLSRGVLGPATFDKVRDLVTVAP